MTDAMPARGRIAVFFALGTIGTVPGLTDAMTMLAEEGYSVDLYLRGSSFYPPPEFDGVQVEVMADEAAIFSLGPTSFPRLMMGRGHRPYSWIARQTSHRLWRSAVFAARLRRRHRQAPYRCIIALDSQALVDCGRYANVFGVPLVFWSLELMFWSDLRSRKHRTLKREEARWSRRASLLIAQDEWRGEALCSENRLDRQRLLYVPNAPRGSARRERSNYLRQVLGIDASRWIVLSSGAIEPWAMTLDLVKAAASWPEKYVLVIQSRSDVSGRRSPYVESVLGEAAASGKIRVLTKPLPPSRYRQLVDSADIGVSLYDPYRWGRPCGLDRNIELMGYASGKIANYMQSGLPIIVNALKGPRDLVDGYRCGVCVSSVQDTHLALETICRDYDSFSRNACRCFDERLELERHFREVVKRIGELRPQTVPARRRGRTDGNLGLRL